MHGDPDSMRVQWRVRFPDGADAIRAAATYDPSGASMRRQAGSVEVFLGSAVGRRFLHAMSRGRLPRSSTFPTPHSPLQARRMRLCRYRAANWPEKMRKRKAARPKSLSAE